MAEKNRNKSFVKIVADTRNNGEILIAESDFVFLYNNKRKRLITGG